MKCKVSFILSLLLLMNQYHSLDALKASQEYNILRKFHVSISNKLPGDSPMGVHCKSGDDDLGLQTVEAREEYSFSFRLNVVKTTRFWCRVYWDNDDLTAVGDVFWPAEDFITRCRTRHNNCVWIVDQDGFTFYDPGTHNVYMLYQWD